MFQTTIDQDSNSLGVVSRGYDADSGIKVEAWKGGYCKKGGRITITFERFKHTQEQVRAALQSEEFWNQVHNLRICGRLPLEPTQFEKQMIEDHQHDEVFSEKEKRSNW